ncbi:MULTISPECIES: hypothetical protein [Ectopseudomonas]|jgi:hypothetical protein|uniref:Uncharacterized protein n=2 Tax=Ectopseudomonas TaxID=3236654 RepID=A0A1G6PVG8_9GAMM|nr:MULTISPECIES: hypothetical protein [Pseudomonas]ALN21891.1 hypothetical protein DW68_024750 [Pseudomonas mendocina S5.2]KER98055.1 hypothetical protein HN51_24950 [Pseudomonas mendocina]MBP3061939.1 hypothetical protein [Pseudomonas chengduensis]NNB75231.1 hypothetical protein [Pseudomonas chengduensis]SDC83961.1 hypothetical protein SAMN05216576_107107 [Pseudomonas chengduensis]
MTKTTLYALALLTSVAVVGSPSVYADSMTLPECAVNAAQASDVEMALYQSLMRNELGDPPRAAPCTFYERSAAVIASSLESQNGDRWAAVSLYLHGQVLPDDPVVKRVRAFYESK